MGFLQHCSSLFSLICYSLHSLLLSQSLTAPPLEIKCTDLHTQPLHVIIVVVSDYSLLKYWAACEKSMNDMENIIDSRSLL